MIIVFKLLLLLLCDRNKSSNTIGQVLMQASCSTYGDQVSV